LLPILVSVPHGGAQTPPEIAGRVIATPEDIFDDSDAATLDVYALAGEVAHFVSTPIARAFVDLNRAPDDRPPANPDGVVKSETCYGRPIYDPARRLTDRDAKVLLERYYFPYHARLEEAARDDGVRLALDCHSMAAVPPPTSPDRGQRRPLICLSNDDGRTSSPSTMEHLADALAEAFEIERADIWLNRPFKGGYITRSHGGGRLPWIQVELNRSLYLAGPWFDRAHLRVDPARLLDLRLRVVAALRVIGQLRA
jgi:formiminoglutamase